MSTTSHNVILESVGMNEKRADFNNLAEKRYANIIATGKSISWQGMRKYLENRIAGKVAIRPIAQLR